MKKVLVLLAIAFATSPRPTLANVAGGGTGQGSDVTVIDRHDGTVTLANGIVSILIDTKNARLDRVTFTHDNDGNARVSDVLLPGAKGRGQYYYGGFSLGGGAFEYALATDPATNGGAYADVKLLSDSERNGVMEVHFSMLRGSTGFYSTAIMTHRKQDVKFEVGAWGVVTRVTPAFNWLSADVARNFLIGQRSSKGANVPDAPHESTILLDGAQQGQYANKFVYGQDHADLRAWGWSSVGTGGLNVGVWLMTNMEFSNGGPLKRDVSPKLVTPQPTISCTCVSISLPVRTVRIPPRNNAIGCDELPNNTSRWLVLIGNVTQQLFEPRWGRI